MEGQHITPALLETVGRDLLRALLLQQNLAVPAEIECGSRDPVKVNEALLLELRQLASKEQEWSSCGSDSDPSDDNLEPIELVDRLPVIDSALASSLKKYQRALNAPPIIKVRSDLQPCLAKKSAGPKKTLISDKSQTLPIAIGKRNIQ